MNGIAASSTMSLVAGGSWGLPWAAVQFAAFSQALVTRPVHRTTFGSSEIVQRPVILVNEFCSTQLSVESFAVFPESAQLPPKRQSRMVDSVFPFSPESW